MKFWHVALLAVGLVLHLPLAEARAPASYDPLRLTERAPPAPVDVTVHDRDRDRDIPLRIYLPAEDVAAPYIARGVSPRLAVLRE